MLAHVLFISCSTIVSCKWLVKIVRQRNSEENAFVVFRACFKACFSGSVCC